MSNRQQALAIETEFAEMCKTFAAKHGMVVSAKKMSYSGNGDLRMKLGLELSAVGEGAAEDGLAPHVARDIAESLTGRDVLAYPKGAAEVVAEQAQLGQLFKFGASHFGRITGWNRRASKAPLQFTCLSRDGVPSKPTNFKSGDYRVSGIGLRADACDVLDVQIGDDCYIDYQAADENDPEDVSGFYAGRIVALHEGMATVSYNSNPDAGTDDLPYNRIIVRPRFI